MSALTTRPRSAWGSPCPRGCSGIDTTGEPGDHCLESQGFMFYQKLSFQISCTCLGEGRTQNLNKIQIQTMGRSKGSSHGDINGEAEQPGELDKD
jgi:hypothetical protein